MADSKKCAHPILHLSGGVGKVLQRRMRSDGENTGHRLRLRSSKLRRKNNLGGRSYSRPRLWRQFGRGRRPRRNSAAHEPK